MSVVQFICIDTSDLIGDQENADLPFKRTQTLNTLKVRQLLKWDNYIDDHPLIELLNLLQVSRVYVGNNQLDVD